MLNHPPRVPALKTTLAPSEVEWVRLHLHAKIATTSGVLHSQAKPFIQKLLIAHQLQQIQPDVVIHQLQTEISPTLVKINIDLPYPLHWAARVGDLSLVTTFIETGYDLNATDIFGSTPLHLAVMYGHLEVADSLIEHGANINAPTYEVNTSNFSHAFTPLALAAKYAPSTEILELLLEKGAEPQHWGMVVDAIIENITIAIEKNDFANFDLQCRKIDKLVTYALDNLISDVGEESQTVPLSIILQYLASLIPDPLYHDRILQSINTVLANDQYQIANAFIQAKNLTHVFPSAKIYTFKIGPYEALVEAEGHLPLFTVKLAADLLSQYSHHLKANPQKHAIFQNVAEIFRDASHIPLQKSLAQTSEQLYQDYLAGKTIFLPSGWSEHAVGIVLNKDLHLMMVANGGQSFHALPSGLNAYYHQFEIGCDDIYRILTNENRMDLEFKHFYDLGLIKAPEFSFETEHQSFGNCTWYSMLIAEKGLLLLELNDALSDHLQASTLADDWFNELNSFQQTHVLQDYLSTSNLEVAALGDILLQYHNNLATTDEITRATIILDHMTENNPSFFANYIEEHQPKFSDALTFYCKQYGYTIDNQLTTLNIEDILAQASSEAIFSVSDADEPIEMEALIAAPAAPLSQEHFLLPIHHNPDMVVSETIFPI